MKIFSKRIIPQKGEEESRMKINLHVGAHKTATTYIQNRLNANRNHLSNHGVGYMPLNTFRKRITSRLHELSTSSFQFENYVQDFFTSAPPKTVEKIIISDENLVGMCGGVLLYGSPYESGPGRLGVIRKMFPDADITLYMSFRSYESFLCSAYCETLRNNKEFVSFRDYVERVDPVKMNWARILDQFVAAVKPVKTCVWRYEQFRPKSQAILSELAFGLEISSGDDNSSGGDRASFSQVAVDLLQMIAKEKGKKVANLLINAIGDNLPKSAGFDPIDPWSSIEREALKRKYEEDCRSVPADYWLKA